MPNQPSRISRFLRKNWLSSLGLAIGVLGIGLSIYFYSLSTAERVPVLVVDPVKATIIDSKSFPNTTLKVLKEDNTSVAGDVTSLRFYFWNNGKLPIKPEHILRPLILSLSDSSAEILDYKILKCSRPEVVSPKLTRNPNNPANSLNLTFSILEEHDGLTGQIIFAGSPSADVVTTGAIEGSKDIKTNTSLSQSRFWSELLKWIPLVIVFILIVVLINALSDKVSDFLFSSPQAASGFKLWLHRVGQAVIVIVVGGLLLTLLIGALVIFPIQAAKESANSGIIDSVPSSIK